jgi:hypothetical protein
MRAVRIWGDAETSIEYPDGHGIVAVPDDREYAFSGCSCSTRYEARGRTLTIKRKTVIAGERGEPARYHEFRTFLDGVLWDAPGHEDAAPLRKVNGRL